MITINPDIPYIQPVQISYLPLEERNMLQDLYQKALLHNPHSRHLPWNENRAIEVEEMKQCWQPATQGICPICGTNMYKIAAASSGKIGLINQ
ncbi:hypothetical protein ACFLWR_02200 [Chloroflexota bacterium]